MNNPLILVERPAPHVALITLNRPQSCNAINGALAQQLHSAARDVEADADVRVAILMGAGERAFCAGADLLEVAQGRVAKLSTEAGGFAGFVQLPRRKVWIAAVHASVLAGGLEIMLACDFSIATTDSLFGLPEVRRGLVATEGGLYKLPAALPKSVALRMIATGAPINAQQALAYGLVTELVERAQLRDAALTLAASVAANAPLAVQSSMELARTAQTESHAALQRRSKEVLEWLQTTEDFTEGASAFAERRVPRWSGR